MEIEIIDEPLRFRLHGKWSAVENQRYGEVGLRLMNEMWKAVKDAKIQTTGINHWVYMAEPAARARPRRNFAPRRACGN